MLCQLEIIIREDWSHITWRIRRLLSRSLGKEHIIIIMNRRHSLGLIGRMNGIIQKGDLYFHVRMNRKGRSGLQQSSWQWQVVRRAWNKMHWRYGRSRRCHQGRRIQVGSRRGRRRAVSRLLIWLMIITLMEASAMIYQDD